MMEDDSSPPPPAPASPENPPPRSLFPGLISRSFWIVVVLGTAGAIYFLTKQWEFLHRPAFQGQTPRSEADITRSLADSALVYVGLPVLLALGLSLTPKASSALGATMKGITIALLLSAPVFQEGYVCILMSAPIFYSIGALIAWPIDNARRKRRRNTSLEAAFVTIVLGVLALEGTTPATSFPRDNTVTRTRVVAAGIDEVSSRLAATPPVNNVRPTFLHLFPAASSASGSGLRVGDQRHVTFVAYKHIWWDRVEGTLDMHVAESAPDHIRFVVDRDDSYLSHYLKWQQSSVDLKPIDATHTQISWTLEYRRTLDPVWYFGPMQRYAVGLTADKLIDDLCGRAA